MLIREMKKQAEAYLGIANIQSVCVTIPVYFSKPQIAATIVSCELAGLKVLRSIKESQAIALGIYHANTNKEDRNVLIINLGGSSLDVAVIAIQEQLFEVKSMHGDTALGGQDFVRRLMEHCLHEFGEKQDEHIIDNKFATEQLRVQCEMAKKLLTKEESARIVCPKLSNNKDLDITIDRVKYEQICDDLISRIVPPIVMVMKDADLNVTQIDEVALVGDFTQTPMISNMISEMFKGKKIRHPNGQSHFLAAHGASLECAVVMGISGQEHKDLLQLDATSRGLGIETDDGDMIIMIPRNTVFPCQKKYVFTTTKDGQTDFAVKMFEGDAEKTTENEYLGSFILEGLSEGSKGGSQKIEVIFDIDGNRNLTVTA